MSNYAKVVIKDHQLQNQILNYIMQMDVLFYHIVLENIMIDMHYMNKKLH